MTRYNFLAATALGFTLSTGGLPLHAQPDATSFRIEGLPEVSGRPAAAEAPDAFAFEIRAPGRPSARPARPRPTLTSDAALSASATLPATPPPGPDVAAGPRLAGLGEVAPRARAARPLWTRTGMLDLTFGRDIDAGEGWNEARGAFFVEGPLASGWSLTASADTRARPLDDLLDGLTGTHRRDALNRLRADPGAVTFGDDSALLHSGGTDGRLFARLSKDDSHLTFGQSRVSLAEGDLIRADRSIYGLSGRHAAGRTTLEGFASSEDSRPETDEFAATGGASYRLAHRDVLPGTVQLTVERRDENGRLIERRRLVEGIDFSVNHVQGHVLLGRPLVEADTGALFADEKEELVLRADYARPANGVDDVVAGLRARHDLGGGLRVGVTALNDESDGKTGRVMGLDVRHDGANGLSLGAEIAHSEGPGRAVDVSPDGGFTFTRRAAGAAATEATAWRLEARADLERLAGVGGQVEAWAERREAGFAGAGAPEDERLARSGIEIEAEIFAATKIGFGAELTRRGAEDERELRVSLTRSLGEETALSFGLEREEVAGAGSSGSRTDAALRLSREFEAASGYAFAEGSLEAEGDLAVYDRYGLGVSGALTERLMAEAEVSFGSAGAGLEAGLTYARDDGEVYLRQRLAGDETATITGHELVLGSRRTLSDDLSIFTEQDVLIGSSERKRGQSYGLSYAPGDYAFDLAATIDEAEGDATRRTLSFGAEYTGERHAGRARLEWHDNDLPGDDSRGFLVFAESRQVTADEGGTLRARVEYAHEEHAGGADGEYAEAGLSYALRPIQDDDLMLVLSYDMRADLDRGAVGAADAEMPLQRSHVFSADFDYRLGPALSAGAKYGVRLGEVAYDRDAPVWDDSTTHIFVMRGEWRFAENWDLLLEYRALYHSETDSLDHGILVAPYYEVNDNLKVGVGYDFGGFSTDFTDYGDRQGLFVNAVYSF